MAESTLIFGLEKFWMLFSMYTSDFTDEEWTSRPAEHLHSGWWLLGHLALSLRQAGGNESDPLELKKWFDYGAPEDEDNQQWPAVGKLKDEIEIAYNELHDKWINTEQTVWETVVPENRLNIQNNAQGACFSVVHAVYHAGQLGAIRRILGKKGIV
jgi:hypothetical protein